MASVNPHGAPHPELHALRIQLQNIIDDMSRFRPIIAKPPVLDCSFDAMSQRESADVGISSHESVPGLRALRDSVRQDLDVMEKFLDDPNCASLPPLSTNAPYLISVWNEVIVAPPPVTAIWRTYVDGKEAIARRKRGSQKPPGVKVDVVADNGRRWIRVNT